MEKDPKRYAIWNNKGGVGKTTLTYLLSTEYAKKRKDCNIIVIDMCPQTNISEMLLGGNGVGEENLEKLYLKDRSIASYIKARYDRSRFSKLGAESSYFVNAHEFNKSLPENIYLLPGHNDLDLCVSLINYLANAPEKRSWWHSRKILSELVESFGEANKERENVFFIDCNPSFTTYTELAILASTRLIIPCTADAASIRGIRNIFKVIYGKGEEDDNPFFQFSTESDKEGFVKPKIHSVIQNKSRSHEAKPSSAFLANIKELESVVNEYHKNFPELFLSEHEVLNIKDGNTLATVFNHTGIPLSDLVPPNQKAKKYQIYDDYTQVDRAQQEVLLRDLEPVLSML
uniref:AAA domain-containing protein n=1 Tax=Candidatus Kentrum sp. FW TaxID=2126338 RepID=A0A450U1B3_9GAMM|nr:MAG: AAA domain-containing protein [Candidatus Kentron sp. FW]